MVSSHSGGGPPICLSLRPAAICRSPGSAVPPAVAVLTPFGSVCLYGLAVAGCDVMSKKRKNKYVRNRDALLVVTFGGVHHQENAGLPVPIPVNNLVSLTGNCLVLTGGLNAHGYGTRNGKYEHRRYYEEYKGVIGDGMGVNHLCGRPYCVQPAHLYQGTAGDNARDRRLHRGGAKWGDMIRVRDPEVGPVIYDTPPHTHSLWTEGRSLECPHECWSGICAICGRPKGR